MSSTGGEQPTTTKNMANPCASDFARKRFLGSLKSKWSSGSCPGCCGKIDGHPSLYHSKQTLKSSTTPVGLGTASLATAAVFSK